MDAFIGLFSLLLMAICIIGLIYSAIRKKSKKKWGIGFVVGVVLLGIALSMPKDETAPANPPTAKTEEPAEKQTQEITAELEQPATEEQKELVLGWYKEFHAVSTEFDDGFAPFMDCIQQIQNGTISPEDAAAQFDLVYTNMDSIVHKLNDINAPDGVTEEQRKLMDDCVLSLQKAAQERRGACMTLRDGLNNGTLNKTKIEIATKKLQASKDHVITASANLVTAFSKAGIDLSNL